ADAAAQHLCQERPAVDGQRHDERAHVVQEADTYLREPEIRKIDKKEERDVADELHVRRKHSAEDAGPGGARECTSQPDETADEGSDQGPLPPKEQHAVQAMALSPG